MVGEIKTEPIIIVEKKTAGAEKIGSATITGDHKGQVTRRHFFAKGSAEFTIADKTGTVGITYLEAAGAELIGQGDVNKPVESLHKGTVNIYKLTSGSIDVGVQVRIDRV